MGSPPRTKISHSDPSTDRSIRNVRQLKQVFEPYRTMFKEVKVKKEATSHLTVSAKESETLKMLKRF